MTKQARCQSAYLQLMRREAVHQPAKPDKQHGPFYVHPGGELVDDPWTRKFPKAVKESIKAKPEGCCWWSTASGLHGPFADPVAAWSDMQGKLT
jgi:hypothetical protein